MSGMASSLLPRRLMTRNDEGFREVFVENSFGGASDYSALLGAIWPCRDTLALDLAARAAREGGAQAREVRLGLTWTTRVWGDEARQGPASRNESARG
jgi:hypothetical protein